MLPVSLQEFCEFSSTLPSSDLGRNTVDPTNSEEEHEDVFQKAIGEFTRILWIQLSPSLFRFGWKTP